MEEKEFFNKLENNRLEAKEVPSHRRQLRSALLSAGLKRRSPFRNPVAKAANTAARIFTSRQPVWRVMVASALVISLAGIFFASRSSTARAPEEEERQVVSILQNDSEFMHAFGGEAFTSVKVLNIRDNVATAAISGTTCNFLTFVDLSAGKVTHYNGNREGFTETEKAEIAQILNSDARTKDLLDRGGVLKYILVTCASPAFHNSAMTYSTNAAVWVSLTLSEPEPFVLDGTTFYENRFNIMIDMDRQEISPIEYIDYGSLRDADLVQILDVLRTDPRTSNLLDAGAVFLEITGMNTQSKVNIGPSATSTLTERTATLVLQLDDKYYQADVDVSGNQVTGFTQVENP